MKSSILTFNDLHELSLWAARMILDLAGERVEASGLFTLVLSGGSTPETLYSILAREPFLSSMPWDRTHLFWGDERCVPPDHPASNYGMAHRALLAHVPVPPLNVHRIPAEVSPPDRAAEACESHLRDFFGASEPGDRPARGRNASLPGFDLVLLGLGSDGHTVSLFPGDLVLGATERWAAAVSAPGGSDVEDRITLTLRALNTATHAAYLVSGSGKREVFEQAAGISAIDDSSLPAARIRPRKNLIWMVDFPIGH